MGKRLFAVWVTLGIAFFVTVYLVTYQEKLRLDLGRLAGPDGVLLLAGFKDVQAEPLRTGYEERGWFIVEERRRDGWSPEPPPELSYTWVAWLLRRLADK